MVEEIGAKMDGTAERLAPLRLSRVLHARCETVFNAWTSTDHIKRWFSPETYTVPQAKVVMEVGGAFDLCMRSPSGEEHWIRGRFVEIKPNTRLVIDMKVTDGTGQPLFRAYTEVDFSDALGGTRIDVVQSYTLIDPSKAWMVTGAPDGWRTTLDKLAKEVVRLQAGAEGGSYSVVHATFHLERDYEAPVARIWEALTDETAKHKWFVGTPGRWELIERRMDVRVGGRERLKGRWEGGVITTFDAVYHDVIPNKRLI